MKAILLLLQLLGSVAFAAQLPQPLAWVRQEGTNGFDRAESIAVNDSGELALVGTFTNLTRIGTNVFVSPGEIDGFVAKFDFRGSNLWARAISGVNRDRAQGVAIDPDGNVYATGFFSDTVDFGGQIRSSAGSNDLFVAKYDSNGTLSWLFTGGGSGRDEGFPLDIDAQTNVYVAGIFRGASVFGGVNLNSAGGATDLLLLKLNSAGQLQWIIRGGGTGSDEPRGMAVDPLGNSYIAGTFGGTASYGSATLVTAGQLDAMVLKYDRDGNLLWAFRGGGVDNDEARRVTFDSAGNVFFNGYYGPPDAQFGSFYLTNGGGDDFYTAKLNESGQLVWISTGGGTGNDSGRGIAVDLEGNVFSTGYYNESASFGGVVLTNPIGSGSTEMPLLKYDRDGNLQWAQQLGGTSGDQAFDLTSDSSGNVYICGQFAGVAGFSGTNLTSAGGADIFFGKLTSVTPPRLLLSESATNATLSWSLLASEFRLESAAALSGLTLWTNIPLPPQPVGGSNSFSAPRTGSQQYWRLVWP